MRGGIGDQRRQQRGVEHQHGAGDAGHAAGHHQEQFAARQLRQIRPDEQGRFHHAEEDVGGGGKPDRAADAERAFQKPRHAAHDRRQDAPVEQQRRQHAHDQHHRQRLERENEIRAGRLQVERQRAAAEIAEHEGGAGARGRRNRPDRVVDDAEGVRDDRQLDQDDGGEQGDEKPDGRLPQRNAAAVLPKREGDREQRQHAERRLQLKHDSPEARGDYGSGTLRSAMLYPANAGAAALTTPQGSATASLETWSGRLLTIRREAEPVERCRP